MSSQFNPRNIRFDDDQRDALHQALGAVPYPTDGPFAAFIQRTKEVVTAHLNPAQRACLRELTRDGVIVCDNVPHDVGVAHGPRDPEAAGRAKATDISEALLTGMVAQQGTPYAVVQEGASLVSDVAAKQGKARSLTGIGSVPLDLHIENAFGRTFQRDLAPAGLALVGVCREPGRSPATPVADARLALAALAPAQAAILREPRFLIARPERWRGPDKAPHRRTAIATGSATAPAFIIATYGDMIKPCDAEAADALAAFIAALERGAVDLAIEPGRLVLIDNRVILHGRRGYRPRFTLAGAPYRWLQRMFWTRALEDFAGWRLAGDHLVDASRPDPE